MSTDCSRKDDKIVLNIGGTRFVTYWSTLQSLPGTRLALLTSQHQGNQHQDIHQYNSQHQDNDQHPEYPDYNRQRSDYNRQRSDYNRQRSDYNRQRSDYNRQRSDYNRQRSDYNRQRSDYNRQRSDYNSWHQEFPGYNRQPEYDKATNEYFYDRNPALFSHILDAYRQGELHVPRCVCAPVLRRELEYWGVAESLLAPLCCVETCTEYEESCRTLQEVDEAFSGQVPPPGCRTDPGAGAGWRQRLDAWRIRTWIFLEDPNSSRAAKIWALLFVLLLLTSVMVVCLDSLPSFRVPSDSNHSASRIDPSYNMSNPLVYNNPKLTMYVTTVQHPAMFYINHCASIFFGAELLVRFLVCPYKKSFLKSFFNIIDVLAVVPTTAASVVSLIDLQLWLQHNLTINYVVFTFTSIFRAIRIVKLMKHYRGLQVMFLALKASSPEMLLLTLLLSIAVIIFSTTIYFAELHHPDTFPSIPVGFWWSVVTMTTVGYGDSIPQTPGGYVVGALCAVSGMLITGLPIPIMANNFRLYYTSAKLHAKLEARDAKLQAGQTQLQTNSPKLHAKLQAREAKLQAGQTALQGTTSAKLHTKLTARETKGKGQETSKQCQHNSSQGPPNEHSGLQGVFQDRRIILREPQNGLHGGQNGVQDAQHGQRRNSLYGEQNGTQGQYQKSSPGGAGSRRLSDSDITLDTIHKAIPHHKVQLDL